MKRTKLFSVLLLLTILFVICTVPVHADTGPKPSVRVEIIGLENETYYVTLLSQTASTGPATAYDGTNPNYQEGDKDYDIWRTFVEHEDTDGFYFLQQFRYPHILLTSVIGTPDRISLLAYASLFSVT